MNDIQAQALADQIEAAYYDQSPEADLLFEVLLDRAIDLMNERQYAALNQRLGIQYPTPTPRRRVRPFRHTGTHTHRHACMHARIHAINPRRRAQW